MPPMQRIHEPPCDDSSVLCMASYLNALFGTVHREQVLKLFEELMLCSGAIAENSVID